MKHYIRQKTDNSIQYTRHLIHKPRSIVLSKGHLTRNTFKSNIFMLINKLIVKFYVHGSLGVLQSWYLAYWWVSNCFFHELSYVKSLDFGPTFFVVIFNVICLTINNLSGILDTTDTSFVHPWGEVTSTPPPENRRVKIVSIVISSPKRIFVQKRLERVNHGGRVGAPPQKIEG